MNEPIRTKRYVCPVCSGSSKTLEYPDEDADILVPVEMDCPACIKQGLPPSVELPLPGVEVTVK